MKHIFILTLFLFSLNGLTRSQTFTDSNLPIVIINTDNAVAIPDSPRVLANMKIIFRGAGLRNYLTDQDSSAYLDYNGRINIEVRGSSTQELPKKQYGFSTLKDDNITNNNISLLGFPADNDWILNGLGFEPSCMRDFICYNLSRMIGEYASRTAYCEVVINGSYNGLYVLQEKIKQGSGRVNIMKIDPNDVTFPKVTGGYITKSDKTTGGDPIAWTMSSYLGINDVPFINVQPKPEIATAEQTAYIKSQFSNLSSTTIAQDASFETGYPSVIDIPSFVDYMIINELSANVDAYQYSTFYHKDRNGKLRAGPIWDLNLTFGNDLFQWGYDRSKTDTWQFYNGDNVGPLFWIDLYNDPYFKCCLSRRWKQLTQTGGTLHISVIDSLIDNTEATISEAVVRENTRWGTIPDFSGEVLKIKNFILQRANWMTQQLNSATDCCNLDIPSLVITKIMYNPETTTDFPNSNDQEFIEITNTGNLIVNLTGIYFAGTGFVYQFPAYTQINPGESKIIAADATVFRERYGFAAFGQFTRNLSNSGENLILADGFGNEIDHVQYSDLPPWPDASGNGKYLELVDPSSDNNVAANWIASSSTIQSVENVMPGPEIRIYPTPAGDYLNVESSGIITSIQMFDILGRLLKTSNINSEECILDMTRYHRGIYIIKISTSRGDIIRKVIKN
jgi:hypothetical protein